MVRTITPSMVETDGTVSSLKRLEFSDKLIDEDFLRNLMDRFPQIIPIDAIESSCGQLISLGREIDNIDNLYISQWPNYYCRSKALEKPSAQAEPESPETREARQKARLIRK